MSRLIRRAPRPWTRREFLRHTLWTAGAAGAAPWLAGCDAHDPPAVGPNPPPPPAASRFADIGPLGGADANGLRLPAGFTSRVVAVSNEIPVIGSTYPWHFSPDGGATYPTPSGGWIYVSNSEVPGAGPLQRGGVGALRFGADGALEAAYPILSGTAGNCAGGKTPWDTWLSCEEKGDGQVWECNPFESGNGTARPALGLFAHEAVCVDPVGRVLYLTEDEGDGRFYRFTPSPADWPATAARPALAAGTLQVLRYAALAPGEYPPESFDVTLPHAVIWEDVVAPDQPQGGVRDGLGASAPGTRFRGGEGIWYFAGIVYFSTKSDNRIWALDVAAQTLEAIYDFSTATPENAILSGVDNLVVSSAGDVLVAEDGGDMQICVILPDRRVIPLLQATDLQAGTEAQSELTGPAFSPDGRRLYFSAQRNGRNGTIGPGITFEVTMPFAA